VRVQVTVPTDTLPLLEDVTTLTATLGALTAVAHDTTTVACEPIVDADFTYAPTPIAVNRSTTFTGTAMGSLPQTYTWDFDDGTAVQAGNPTVHAFSTPGSFTVTMMVANSCTAQYSMTRAVMVYALPDLTLDPTALNVAVPLDSSTTRTIDLGNVGSADLIWSLVMTPTVTWLDVTPTNGNIAPAGSVSLGAEFDATGLPEDVYTTTLRLTSNDPDTPLVIVPVTMTVGGAWNIYLPLVLRNY
jgi:PKD repeat protein